MRISDWSSDVCSSGLGRLWQFRLQGAGGRVERTAGHRRCRIACRCAISQPRRAYQEPVAGQSRPGRYKPAELSRVAVVPANRKPHQHINLRLFRSEEHTSELQSLMRISYAVFCLKKKKKNTK